MEGHEYTVWSVYFNTLFLPGSSWCVSPVLEWCPNGNVQYILIWVWIVSLSMSSMFTHLAAYFSHPSLPRTMQYFRWISKPHSHAHRDSGLSSLRILHILLMNFHESIFRWSVFPHFSYLSFILPFLLLLFCH